VKPQCTPASLIAALKGNGRIVFTFSEGPTSDLPKSWAHYLAVARSLVTAHHPRTLCLGITTPHRPTKHVPAFVMHTDGVMEMAGSHAMCQHKLMGSQPKLGLLRMYVQTQHALHMKAHTAKTACTSQGLATTASTAATPAKPADCKGSRKHKSSRSSQTKTASNSYTDRS
jgi:hypothetical protein